MIVEKTREAFKDYVMICSLPTPSKGDRCDDIGCFHLSTL